MRQALGNSAVNEHTARHLLNKFRPRDLSFCDESLRGRQQALDDEALPAATEKDSSLTCGGLAKQFNEVNKGVMKKDIALKFDISPNSLSAIIKNLDKLQNYDSSNSCSKRLRTCVYEDVDEAVLKWMHTMRDQNDPISGPFVTEKALHFAKALGCDQFLGSNIWLEKFKISHGIVAKLKEKQDITDSAQLDDFLFLDFEAETSGSQTKSDILNIVTNKNSTAMDCNEDEDENENDDNAEINKPSYDEMINSFETIRLRLQSEENTPEVIFGAL
ncbi:tigger transposable element-derived protein 4 [Nephila pilipes]|uniref:Tigger transposable element-derived protein 4 n=1 Tax=Nephila pilipes TaxID=299642 RepID=A0A8X6PB58_NEPPI|nr:tigger transposable element-derived protein 4 [Nephila pilipes]